MSADDFLSENCFEYVAVNIDFDVLEEWFVEAFKKQSPLEKRKIIRRLRRES